MQDNVLVLRGEVTVAESRRRDADNDQMWHPKLAKEIIKAGVREGIYTAEDVEE
jgi:hypothetical protein